MYNTAKAGTCSLINIVRHPNSCDCSESWERTFIYYYSMVVMSIYIFTGAILLLVILCTGSDNIMNALGKVKKSKTIKSKKN